MSLVSVEQLNANPELLAVPELCQGLAVYEIVKQRDLDKCRGMSLYNFLSTPGFGCNVTNGAGCQAMMSVSASLVFLYYVVVSTGILVFFFFFFTRHS